MVSSSLYAPYPQGSRPNPYSLNRALIKLHSPRNRKMTMEEALSSEGRALHRQPEVSSP